MLIRKHFISLASNLANERPEKKTHARYQAWLSCCQAVARTCHESNYNFDRDRFMTACKEW